MGDVVDDEMLAKAEEPVETVVLGSSVALVAATVVTMAEIAEATSPAVTKDVKEPTGEVFWPLDDVAATALGRSAYRFSFQMNGD